MEAQGPGKDSKVIQYYPSSSDRVTGLTLIPPDDITSSEILKNLLGGYQQQSAFDLLAMLEACDRGEEFYDQNTLPFSSVAERRSFILDLEAQYEATHEWVRIALVQQGAIDQAAAVLDTIAGKNGDRRDRRQETSSSPVSSISSSNDEVNQQSPLKKLEDELADDQSIKVSESNASRSSGFESSLDEEDFEAGKLETKLNLLTQASRKRFETDILARKVKRDALIRKVKVRCQHISGVVKSKMPRKRSDEERRDKSELQVFEDVLRQASVDRTLLEQMQPYAAAAFETRWGQEMAETMEF